MTYEQPEWITQELTPSDIAAILQGGCASGAYMPAVTYYHAAQTPAAQAGLAVGVKYVRWNGSRRDAGATLDIMHKFEARP